jgi:hypothetical protein
MPAGDRPRRSTRNTRRATSIDEPPKKQLEKSDNDNDDDNLLYDSASGSDSDNDNDIVAKPWLKQKSKSAPPPVKEKPIIPKRKRDTTASVVKGNKTNAEKNIPAPPKVEIKRKKKDDGVAVNVASRTDKPPASSLIANMAPVDKKKFQPALRDWKPNAVFQKVRPPKPVVTKVSGNKTPPIRNQQQQQSQSQSQYLNKDPMQDINRSNHSSNDTSKVKLGNKIREELNGLIFKVLEGKGTTNKSSLKNKAALTSMDLLKEVSDVIMKDKTEKSNAIDWHGSFLSTDNEENLDFGDLEQDHPVPMFPEDFSKQKQWPLDWWGIIPPSDELLEIHNGRTKSRSSKEKSNRDTRSGDTRSGDTRSGDTRSGDTRSGDRERGRRDERGRGATNHQQQQQHQHQQPFQGEGWGNHDYRGPPPPGQGGHYGPPPQRERGGWDDPRMNDERWRGGGGGRGFGPGQGPSRGAYGPGPYPRR